ncbi:MAG: DUF4160 domain-containing protein [Chloroflexi bacterium]|nr:DUF4160 domain-containing protein [Chloroflexota bacterium]MYJ91424.1 DUF4160 domain-containing protein [Chloroflexota bacterium]
MPEICRFGGIKILMYYDDHNWPHVHVRCAEDEASFDLTIMAFTTGQLPKSKEQDFLDWAMDSEQELLEAWKRAERKEPIGKIASLRQQ